MDVMLKFKNEFFEERKDLLGKNHVYRNHINIKTKPPLSEEDSFLAGFTLTMIEANIIRKIGMLNTRKISINKSIAQNDYYCYV